MAGTCKFYDVVDDRLASLLQVTWELVSTRQRLEFSAPGKHLDPKLRQSVNQSVQATADEHGCSFAVETRSGLDKRHECPQGRLDLVGGERADVISEMRERVELGK